MLTLWIIILLVEIAVFAGFKTSFSKAPLQRLNNSPTFIKIISLLIRVGTAGMFLAACYGKILSPYDFAELVAQYQLLPEISVNFFSLWLPIFELVLAMGIVLTKWSREFTAMLIVLFVIFIIALAQALIRNLGITCGCFDIEGAQDKTGAWISLLRDIALLPVLIWLLIKGSNRYVWDFR